MEIEHISFTLLHFIQLSQQRYTCSTFRIGCWPQLISLSLLVLMTTSLLCSPVPVSSVVANVTIITQKQRCFLCKWRIADAPWVEWLLPIFSLPVWDWPMCHSSSDYSLCSHCYCWRMVKRLLLVHIYSSSDLLTAWHNYHLDKVTTLSAEDLQHTFSQ